MRALDTHAELSETLMRHIIEALEAERARREPKTRVVDLEDPYDFIIEHRR